MLKDGTICALSPGRCRAKLAACSTLLAAWLRAAATELLTLPEPAEPMDRRGPARMKLRGGWREHVSRATGTTAPSRAQWLPRPIAQRLVNRSVSW